MQEIDKSSFQSLEILNFFYFEVAMFILDVKIHLLR